MTFFPDPSVADESAPAWDEPVTDYLLRSTSARAAGIRDFLNAALGHFEPRHARSLAKRLRSDFQGHFFEIIVGRYLQVLGAEVTAGPLGTNGTRVDYQANFADGIISVECVSKRFNKSTQTAMARNSRMVSMLEPLSPGRWILRVRQLPDVSNESEFEPYLTWAEEWLAMVSKLDSQHPQSRSWNGQHGEMRLDVLPYERSPGRMVMGPGHGFVDDSVERLKDALIDSHKRRQALGSHPPVFLAVDCPFNGPDAGDFDRALFGLTVEHRGFDIEAIVGHAFEPNGLLVRDREVPFAGVIAFLGMQMTQALDPIVYLNPRQRWALPAAISAHELRVWTSEIAVTRAERPPLMGDVGFVRYED
jgi:hypothetical protein